MIHQDSPEKPASQITQEKAISLQPALTVTIDIKTQQKNSILVGTQINY